MTEAMPFLQKTILLSYDPRPFAGGYLFCDDNLRLRGFGRCNLRLIDNGAGRRYTCIREKGVEHMEPKRAYSAKGVLTALGKSLLYLLFFLAIQFLAGIIYAVIAVAGASLFHGEADAGSILAGTETAVLFAYLLTAAAILLWFRLRHKPLGEGAGLRRCSGWTAAFCAFAAVGLFVVLRLALALLPTVWLSDYNDHMELLLSTGLIPALSIAVAGPLAEELMFRGFIFGTLKRRWRVLPAMLVTAAIFGIYHMSLSKFFTTALLGFMLVYVVEKTGSIFCSMLMHFCNNLVAVVVMKYSEQASRAVPILTKSSYVLSDYLLLVGVACIGLGLGWFLLKKTGIKKQ